MKGCFSCGALPDNNDRDEFELKLRDAINEILLFRLCLDKSTDECCDLALLPLVQRIIPRSLLKYLLIESYNAIPRRQDPSWKYIGLTFNCRVSYGPFSAKDDKHVPEGVEMLEIYNQSRAPGSVATQLILHCELPKRPETVRMLRISKMIDDAGECRESSSAIDEEHYDDAQSLDHTTSRLTLTAIGDTTCVDVLSDLQA